MTHEDQLEQIRDERRKGEVLGQLAFKYGTDLVVEALGIHHIAHSLGLTEDKPDQEDIDGET